MTEKIRFHLDENIRIEIALGLRRFGVDVTTSGDVSLLGADDNNQLFYATEQGRILVTHDRDFLVMHAVDCEHAGIAYCHSKKHDIGAMLRALVLLWTNRAPKDMHGRVAYL